MHLGKPSRLLTFALALTTQASLTACGSRPQPDSSAPSIYGGKPVPDGELGAIVALAYGTPGGARYQLECSGTLVAPDLVLTAGHCLKGDGIDAAVLGGEIGERLQVYIGSGVEGGLVPGGVAVERAVYHPMLRAHPLGYADYGLVFLKEPLADAEPIPLVTSLDGWLDALANGRVTVVGYGQREDRGVGRKFKVTTDITSYTSQEATAGGGGKDGCDGDSGGPALTAGKDGTLRQLGLVSRGLHLGCGDGGILSLVADGACWLADASGGRLGPSAASCDSRIPAYTDAELDAMQPAQLCSSGTAGQQETLHAVQRKLGLTTCQDAAAALTAAADLNLDYLMLRDLSPLAALPHLASLSVRGNRLADLAPLRRLKGLKQLHIEANDVHDLTPLTPLAATGLKIYGKRQQLWNFTATEFLRLCQDQTTPPAARQTIRAVFWTTETEDCATANERLLSLTRLSLSGRGLTDLTPLAGLEGLQALDLSGNAQLADAAPLAGLEGLRTLDVTGTAVVDLAPLAAQVADGLVIKGAAR